MKPRLTFSSEAGMTLLEVVVLALALVLVLLVFLPALAASHKRSAKINCTNNLKQIGLAYRIWSGDNNDYYPMGFLLPTGVPGKWLPSET